MSNATRMSARMRSTLTKSAGRFLAWCSIMKACRSQPQLRRGGPIVLVLVLPPEADAENFSKAARLALEGRQFFERRFGDSDTTNLMISWADERPKKVTAADTATILRCERAILLVRNRTDIPAELGLGADAVVELEPPDARHVAAAIRLCVGQSATEHEVAEIASMPMSLASLMLRRGRPLRRTLEAMRLLSAPPPEERKRDRGGELRLEDLHGLGEAGDWGRELATDLSDWRSGRIAWTDVDRGVLLSGPPGTGKTTFAKALATSCDAHLVLGSLGRWQARGHLGDLLKAMRAAFQEAQDRAPSILFIDEIDAFGDREKFAGHNSQYSTEVVAAFLECIDGAEGREGVVVVGACNHPQHLDAAIVRPGRLDRHVRIRLPDKAARIGILRWHLAGALDDGVDLSGIALRTEGWSGAGLEQLARDARRRARRARRTIQIEDLIAVLPPMEPIPAAMLRRGAIHEAGHVVVALALGLTVNSVEISSETELRSGYSALGGVQMQEKPIWERTTEQLLDRICLRLAGLAAEDLILGSRSAGGGGAPGSDLHEATIIATRIEASYGLGRGLALLSYDHERELLATLHTAFGLRDRVEEILAAQMERVRGIVRDHRSAVLLIADALLERGKLSIDDVKRLVRIQPSPSETVECDQTENSRTVGGQLKHELPKPGGSGACSQEEPPHEQI